MPGKFVLDCGYCGRRFDASNSGMRCQCDGPLVVNTDLGPLKAKGASREVLRDPYLPGIFAFLPLLPITNPRAATSLCEGNTPLTRAGLLAERLAIETLYLKDETRNPTGSFKDRMLAVGVARAVELGRKTIAVQSSGNVAAATAPAALKKLLGEGRIRRQDRVCCILTGLGFKDMNSARKPVPPIETICLSREAVSARVGRA